MLTSKDIIEKTGISRATLNNYIASGLVARPEVLPPGPDDGDAPRIGYFPDDTIERIETIHRLKREGWSIGQIAEHFARGPATAPTAPSREVTSPVPATERMPAASQEPPRVHESRIPTLTAVAVLVATLEDAPGLWGRLSAQEYFELVNEIWAELDRIFRGHSGLLGRHPDEGLVCYFLPGRGRPHIWNAVTAALDVRDAMRQVSLRWQARKGWDVQLVMNTGLDEGEDWMGSVGAGDLRVLGEAADRAEQLSRCSSGGAVLVTRRLIGKLLPHEQGQLAFGVPDAAGFPRLLSTFTRLADIGTGPVPQRLADLAVAQAFGMQEVPVR